MSDEASHVIQDTGDAVAAFVRTSEVLSNSGVSMLDMASAMTVLLTATIQCLPEPARTAARNEYSEFVKKEAT